MAVNTAQIKSLLLPGLYEVAGKYDELPTMWSKVFEKKKSKLATETKAQMRFLALGQVKVEGGATYTDNSAGQRYLYNATSFEIGLA